MTKQNERGFTLVELLCAVVVMLLLGTLLATGTKIAVAAFERSMAASQAQTLLSTLQTSVSDELRYAGTIQLDADGKPTGFFSRSYGEAAYAGFSEDTKGHVLLGGSKLLPDRAYPNGLQATVELTGYDAATRVFSAQITVYGTQRTDGALAQTEFEVRQLNVPAALPGDTETGGG